MNTKYFLNLVAGNVFRSKETPAIPTKYYIGLSKTEPNETGGNVTEPETAAGYARVELNSLGEPVDGLVRQSTSMSLPTAGALLPTLLYMTPTRSARATC